MLAECVILTKITVAASFIITMRRNEYVILMSAMHCCGITDFIGFEIRYFSAFVERKSAPPCWRVGRKLYLVKPMGWHGGSEASWSWQRRRAVMHFHSILDWCTLHRRTRSPHRVSREAKPGPRAAITISAAAPRSGSRAPTTRRPTSPSGAPATAARGSAISVPATISTPAQLSPSTPPAARSKATSNITPTIRGIGMKSRRRSSSTTSEGEEP